MKLPSTMTIYLWIGLGLVAIFVLVQIFQHPKQVFWLIVRTAVMGCLFILAVDWVGQYFHYHLPFNPLTAAAAGLLGVPGVAALIALQLWLYP